jgi:hypothetical protein
MENDEHEGVTINVDTTSWPENLVGVRINEVTYMIQDGNFTMHGDPIWSIETPERVIDVGEYFHV